MTPIRLVLLSSAFLGALCAGPVTGAARAPAECTAPAQDQPSRDHECSERAPVTIGNVRMTDNVGPDGPPPAKVSAAPAAIAASGTTGDDRRGAAAPLPSHAHPTRVYLITRRLRI